MATDERSEVAKKALTIEPGGSISGPESETTRASDRNVKEGEDTIVTVNRMLELTETTVETMYAGENGQGLNLGSEEKVVDGDGAEDKVVPELNDISDGFTVVNENGASFVVEVHGSPCGVSENGVLPYDNFGNRKISALISGDRDDETDERKGDGTGIFNQGNMDEDGDGEIVNEGKHEFLVGDFVWGKIKSHPWWPGQVYNPSSASSFALKFKHGNRILVAYFGDGSCAWCSPSQLAPFEKQFQEMSKQSTSKSFRNAVDKALEEIGRRAELKMICSCVPKENLVVLARPEALNAGVRYGVLVPEGDIDRLPSPWREPPELLEYVKYLAQAGSVINLLELVLTKSWLSAFCRVRRGSCLATYHEPQLIKGLEDKSKNVVLDTNDFSVPIEVPIQRPTDDEWHSSSKASQEKGLILSADKKVSQMRKQKSVAELMGEDTGVKPKVKKKSKSTEKTPLTTVKNKKGSGSEALNESLSLHASTARRKRGEKKTEGSASHGVVVTVQPGRVENGIVQSTRLKENEDSGDTYEKSEKSFMSRDRKKSKYLSPPYTIPSLRVGKSNSKRELETESDNVAKVARVGERLTKVAGDMVGSPPLTKCNGTTTEAKGSDEHRLRLGASKASLQTTRQKEKIKDSMDIDALVNQVLEEVLSAGVDIMSLKSTSLENMKRFVIAFRSWMYVNCSNYKSYHKQKASRKRKYSAPEPGNVVSDLHRAMEVSPQPVASNGNNDKRRSRGAKLKNAARAAAATDNKGSPTALIVSFHPDYSLPTKDEIIKTFSKFGDLNEDETQVLRDGNCAQLAYMRTSDAEVAFKESIKRSPINSPSVSYSLRCPSDPSMALSKSPKKRTLKNSIGLQPKDVDTSQVGLIRQNLVKLTSMLEQCDGKMSLEDKLDLESEVRCMLQKVGELAVKSSS